ncbi:MAG TPA: D-2-hydroxyacid dehydrogenase [Steroidobacteraceae bacterium]|nr:D-2-hydroxyacid dehydrogenase [Steroidobacteraceae bacterium]
MTVRIAAGLLALSLSLLAAPAATAVAAAAVAAEAPAAAPATTAELIESLGLHTAPTPVRERPGWRPPRVILVDHIEPDLLPRLRQAAPAARLVEIAAATPADLAAADATIGVCSEAVLKAATHLQWIQWPAAGVERCVAQPLLRERAPLVTNLQRTFGPSIAEHVLALMMALSRHLEDFYLQQRQGHWQPWQEAPQLQDLEGRTLLVAGLGGIGTEVARRAHALGMRVVATRASGHEGPEFVSYVGLPNELVKLAHEADFVVNCLPLTPETTGLFDKAFFAAMKPTAYFVSVGRGRSTVTADLVAALNAGTIAGAGLDVLDPEPVPRDSAAGGLARGAVPPDDPLWRTPHLLITPHVAAKTAAAEAAGNAVLVENLRRYVAGERMLSVVDITKGY